MNIEEDSLHSYLDGKYSDELLTILDFFSVEPKTFLCIGAQDGLDHTHLLLRQGWTGIYCEPNPLICDELFRNVAPYKDKVTIVNSAVMNKSGLQKFYVCTNISAISSLQETWTAHTMPGLLEMQDPNIPTDPVIQEVITNVISARDLIEFVGTDIDFISIDAEGSDPDIVKNMPWEILDKCKMVFIEYYTDEVHKFMLQHSFTLLKTSNLQNSIYIK